MNSTTTSTHLGTRAEVARPCSAPTCLPSVSGDVGGTRVALSAVVDVVRFGLHALLSNESDMPRPRVVEPETTRPDQCDVVLVGTHDESTSASRVRELVAAGFGLVATIGPPLAPWEQRPLDEAGSRAHLGLDLPAPELVATLQALPDACRGLAGDPADSVLPEVRELAGCTQREAEVLTLICRGLTNQEIAAELFLGINTVKTYVRTAYRKIGVTTRTRAVLWGLHHGL